MRCGETKPMNPIIPETETAAAVAIAGRTTILLLSLTVSQPKCFASASPRAKRLRFFASLKINKDALKIMTSDGHIFPQIAPLSFLKSKNLLILIEYRHLQK